LQNGQFWRERAPERAVLAGAAPERAVLAAGGHHDGRFRPDVPGEYGGGEGAGGSTTWAYP
jgi:hypothetical protein